MHDAESASSLPSWSHGPCSPVEGASGMLLTCLLIAIGFAAYVAAYERSRGLRHDSRPRRVFWFDMSKIAVSQGLAFALNVVWDNALASALGAPRHLQSIAWMVPLVLTNTVVGLPLGAALGIAAGRVCRARVAAAVRAAAEAEAAVRAGPGLTRRAHSALSSDDDGPGPLALPAVAPAPSPDAASAAPCESDDAIGATGDPCGDALTRLCRCNAVSGKYSPSHENTFAQPCPELRVSWLAVQTVVWCVAVAMSRGACVWLVAHWATAYPGDNIFWRLAATVDTWDATCAQKQWAVSGVFRLAMDVLHIAFVDVVNRMPRNRRLDGFVEIPEN